MCSYQTRWSVTAGQLVVISSKGGILIKNTCTAAYYLCINNQDTCFSLQQNRKVKDSLWLNFWVQLFKTGERLACEHLQEKHSFLHANKMIKLTLAFWSSSEFWKVYANHAERPRTSTQMVPLKLDSKCSNCSNFKKGTQTGQFYTKQLSTALLIDMTTRDQERLIQCLWKQWILFYNLTVHTGNTCLANTEQCDVITTLRCVPNMPAWTKGFLWGNCHNLGKQKIKKPSQNRNRAFGRACSPPGSPWFLTQAKQTRSSHPPALGRWK